MNAWWLPEKKREWLIAGKDHAENDGLNLITYSIEYK